MGNLVLVDYVRSMIDLLLDYMNTTVEALEKAKNKHGVNFEPTEYRDGIES